MSEAGPLVGDLVIVPYPSARERLGCGTEVGLALEDRRHVMKVYFPEMDRAFWLEREQLESVPLGRLPTERVVERLHRTAQQVDADQIEFYDGDDRQGVVYVFSRGLESGDVDAVRTLWAEDLVRLRIVPANMRLMRVELTLKNVPF